MFELTVQAGGLMLLVTDTSSLGGVLLDTKSGWEALAALLWHGVLATMCGRGGCVCGAATELRTHGE